jgi:uncharacterized membrane protein YqaE (UPF0057 family)
LEDWVGIMQTYVFRLFCVFLPFVSVWVSVGLSFLISVAVLWFLCLFVRFGCIRAHYNTNSNHYRHPQTRRSIHLPSDVNTNSNSNPTYERTKGLLIKYLALQHYTSIFHASLTHLFPLPFFPHSHQKRKRKPTPNFPKNISHTHPHKPHILPPSLLGMFGTEFGGFFFLPGWVVEWMVLWFVGRAGHLWGRVEEEESGSGEEGKAQR